MGQLRNTVKLFTVVFFLILAVLACDIDQNFAPLKVGTAPSYFDPWVGEIHSWSADVIPGAKYEVILRFGEITAPYSEGGSSDFSVSGKACPDCNTSITVSAINTEHKLSFIAPESGHVTIRLIPRQKYGTSTIQIREFGKETSVVVNLLGRFDLLHIVLAVILSGFIYVGVKKSRLLTRQSIYAITILNRLELTGSGL